MDDPVVICAIFAAVALLYSIAGQAGGTAFLAVMAIAAFPAAEMRPTSLLLNIVAAGYSTWRLHRAAAIDWRPFARLAAPSLPAAFAGGLLVLDARPYSVLTGLLLLFAAILLLVGRASGTPQAHVRIHWTALAGAGVGLLSGITGIGGGTFLSPLLIMLGWASVKQAARLSAPFILVNSIFGFTGALLAGQPPAGSVGLYAAAALLGAILGNAIGLRWTSERAIRLVLAAILLIAGIQLLSR
jgi:uncharacterized membrane protein YfcA